MLPFKFVNLCSGDFNDCSNQDVTTCVIYEHRPLVLCCRIYWFMAIDVNRIIALEWWNKVYICGSRYNNPCYNGSCSPFFLRVHVVKDCILPFYCYSVFYLTWMLYYISHYICFICFIEWGTWNSFYLLCVLLWQQLKKTGDD